LVARSARLEGGDRSPAPWARSPLADEAFGDPQRRLYPVLDQDDVDSAAHLIGKAKNPAAVKRRIIAIARAKGLRMPAAWKDAERPIWRQRRNV
jgi:hypothetical protein